MTTTKIAAKTTSKPTVTKRQKIKSLQKSDLNRWPQQPNIKDPSRRAKAYLTVANLASPSSSSTSNTSPKKKKVVAPLSVDIDLNAPEIKFGRLVGSNDVRKRHDAIYKLEVYLKERCRVDNEGLSELDLLKLWKGLWHCLYMADKVPVQDELGRRLSELIWCVSGTKDEDLYAAQCYLEMEDGDDDDDDDGDDEEDDEMDEGDGVKAMEEDDVDDASASTKSSDADDPDDIDEEEEEEEEEAEDEEDESSMRHTRGAHLASLFLKTFFKTIRRDWGKMDKYRIDKFYTLIRLMMYQVYKYMGVRKWNYGIIRLFNDGLYDEVLSQIPNGMRLHVIDLCLEELAKVEKDVGGVETQIYMNVMEPFWSMCQMEKDEVVRHRCMENIVDKFLLKYSVVKEDRKEGGDADDELVFKKVHVGSIARTLFELGSDEDTIDKYRESLYAAHKTYLKRIKLIGIDAPEEEQGSSSDHDNDDGQNDAQSNKEKQDAQDPSTSMDIEKKEKIKDHSDTEKDASLTKKKRKKKKRGKNEPDAKEDENNANQDENKSKHESSHENESPPPKKNTAPVNNKDTNDDDNDIDENANSGSETKKKRKKKKKKKHNKESPKDDTDVEEAESDQSPSLTSDSDTPKKLPTDKQKKDTDVVITISAKEQKHARQRQQQQQQSPVMNSSDDDYNDLDTPSDANKRRVSFGRVNHSKSHHKSMKDLKTRPIPSTKERTPDKSILLKRENEERKKRGRDEGDEDAVVDVSGSDAKGGKKSKKKKKKKKSKTV